MCFVLLDELSNLLGVLGAGRLVLRRRHNTGDLSQLAGHLDRVQKRLGFRLKFFNCRLATSLHVLLNKGQRQNLVAVGAVSRPDLQASFEHGGQVLRVLRGDGVVLASDDARVQAFHG